jgi:hypothetical protein
MSNPDGTHPWADPSTNNSDLSGVGAPTQYPVEDHNSGGFDFVGAAGPAYAGGADQWSPGPVGGPSNSEDHNSAGTDAVGPYS